MTGTTTVTPSLLVGAVPAELQDAYPATTAGEAIQLIDAGLVAVAPDGAWDLVEDVLRAVIPDHTLALRLLLDAQHGGSARIQCDCPSCLAGLTRSRRRPDGSLIWYDEPTSSRSQATPKAGPGAPG
jgi:hypothetical protein